MVGAGRWGRNLIRAFDVTGEARVAAVCDLIRPATEVLRDRAYFASFDELCRERVQAVVIATPAELHASQAVTALEHGLHVFVEKPMALTLTDATRMRDAARASSRVLMVGHLLHYHPAIVTLRGWIAAGKLGRIERAVALRFGPATRDASGSPWWALAPHDLSVLRYLAGAEITDIAARQSLLGSTPIVGARVRLGSASADVLVSAAHDSKVRRLVMMGTEGTAWFEDHPRGARLVHRAGRSRIDAASALDGLNSDELWQVLPFSSTEPLLAEATHFVTAALTGVPIPTDAEEGWRVVAALEAGAISMARRGAWTRVATPSADRPLWRGEAEQVG